jgi:hypothetical protein
MGHPYIGYIAAAGTNQAAKFADGGSDGWLKKLKKDDFKGPIAAYGPCGKAPKLRSDAPADQAAAAVCFPSFYNLLRRARAGDGRSCTVPYLKGPKEMQGAGLTQSALVLGASYSPMDGPGRIQHQTSLPEKVRPSSTDTRCRATDDHDAKLSRSTLAQRRLLRRQPALLELVLDTQGSLFAGNTYRNNGNGTYETTKPSPFYGINVPFPAGWNAVTNLSGSRSCASSRWTSTPWA